jgi:hypothetical protein
MPNATSAITPIKTILSSLRLFADGLYAAFIKHIRIKAARLRSNLRCAGIRSVWYGEPSAIENAIGYAVHRSRSHNAVIRVYDDAGKVINR